MAPMVLKSSPPRAALALIDCDAMFRGRVLRLERAHHHVKRLLYRDTVVNEKWAKSQRATPPRATSGWK
eukprot:3552670-Prymnesium_polylepis.3